MTTELEKIISDERIRNDLFPVTAHRVFMAHAGVAPLPKASIDALAFFLEQAGRDHQESGAVPELLDKTRRAAARLIGCRRGEISLIGPTSLGLNLVANGLSWREGDEVLCYADDYPANVYPWRRLARRGVKVRLLDPAAPGEITWSLVERNLSPRTRLVALASAHYLSGYRIDIDEIGGNLGARGVLFCLDGIQTLGAFPLSVEHVDFLSADSHKWLLGPLGAGIFYVKESRAVELEPALIGSWNVKSPDFVAQEEIVYEPGGRRYEPGALNVPGILGMLGSMEMLLEIGVGKIARRILYLRRKIAQALGDRRYRSLTAGTEGEENFSGIISFRRPGMDMERAWRRLDRMGFSLSLRRNRKGEAFIRTSPHFYNTDEEVDRLLAALGDLS